MSYKTPIEYQILNLQEIAYRTGWDQGKLENLQWAVEALRENGYPDAAKYLEGISFGEAVSRIKQASRFQPGQHQTGNKTQKVSTPNTSVVWSSHESRRSNEGDDSSEQ